MIGQEVGGGTRLDAVMMLLLLIVTIIITMTTCYVLGVY